MNPFLTPPAIQLFWALCAAGIAWYLARTTRRIRYVTLADGQQQERRLPFGIRLLLPLTPNVTGWVSGPSLANLRDKTDRKLVSAGLEGVLSSHEFLALRILSPLLFGILGVLFLHTVFPRLPGGLGARLASQLVLFDTAILLLAAVSPSLWLRQEHMRRSRSIERALPFVLDLLTLSVEAGLDFMSAMNRIIERRTMDPLGEELLRVFREVQLGKTRREALRAMARRVDHPDIKSVVQALVQADELGVSIGSILRIQSDQMRTRRFQRAEKLANEAPVKMLFPLVAFIFPSVFIILLGPIILQFLQQGF